MTQSRTGFSTGPFGPIGLCRLAPVQQLGELSQALLPVPPQRAGHVDGQAAGLGGAQVHRQVVTRAVEAADDRVLPSGDPPPLFRLAPAQGLHNGTVKQPDGPVKQEQGPLTPLPA